MSGGLEKWCSYIRLESNIQWVHCVNSLPFVGTSALTPLLSHSVKQPMLLQWIHDTDVTMALSQRSCAGQVSQQWVGTLRCRVGWTPVSLVAGLRSACFQEVTDLTVIIDCPTLFALSAVTSTKPYLSPPGRDARSLPTEELVTFVLPLSAPTFPQYLLVFL